MRVREMYVLFITDQLMMAFAYLATSHVNLELQTYNTPHIILLLGCTCKLDTYG